MQQAKFEDRGAGLARVSEGWFVVNVGDAEWLTSETTGPKKRSGAECSFETRHVSFSQLGVRLHVLERGESNGLYHREAEQEDFLVRSGECPLRSALHRPLDRSAPRGSSAPHVQGRRLGSRPGRLGRYKPLNCNRTEFRPALITHGGTHR